MATQTKVLALVLVLAGGSVVAQEPKPTDGPVSLWRRETLTDNWFLLGRKLEAQGVAVGLTLTQIYQVNVRGGTATGRHAGRYTGSWDLQLEADPARLLRLPALAGGTLLLVAEGSWSNGIDDSSIGSLFGANDDAGGNRSIDLTELWYEHELLDGKVRVRAGKIDLTGGFQCCGCAASFDGNAFANDETTQFLNGALVNNPTIPFPDNGLGAMLYVEPIEGFYLSVGAADANADARETGFNTVFTGEDRFLSIYEVGITPLLESPRGPLQGACRIGFWLDSGPVERINQDGAERDNMGLYLSLDQMFWKENADADDAQGLGAFFRYGMGDSDTNEIKAFYSAGVQYQGLLSGRDEDVLAAGFATGTLSAQAGHSADTETVIETYYSIQITPWLTLAPSLQVIFHPGGQRDVRDAVVLGFRCQMSF